MIYAAGTVAFAAKPQNSANFPFEAELIAKFIANARFAADISVMDRIDHKIITLLAEDCRRSLADIGAGVNLSPSAVNERIRRLTASGAIRRFTVEADPEALGLPVTAFIWVALAPDSDEAAFRSFAQTRPEISECHHVTGPWSYLLKIHSPSLAGIEAFLSTLKERRFLARSETMIALSSPVDPGFGPRGDL